MASSISQGNNDGPVYACEKGGATRYVEVVKEPGFACRVKYRKPSATTYPWSARNEAGYCGRRATELVKTLGTFGWECFSDEDVHSILAAHIDRYSRYIKILSNVGKTCHFYPGDAQFGNLCGDARREAVIVYTCEANADRWTQYLAVFLEIEPEPLVEEVGGSEYRQVSSYFIDNSGVILETQKIDSGEETETAQPTAGKTSYQCSYSDASKWELIED